MTTTDSQPPRSSNDADSNVNAARPMHAAIDHAADAVSSATQGVQDGVATMREALGHCVEDVCRLGTDCTEAARETVRTRPLTVIFAALAAGLLFGRLSR